MKKLRVFFAKIFLWYLRFLAKLQIKKIKPVIIGIGGASGKTSLSRFIYIILKDKYKVKYSSGKNSETGIPLSILSINPQNYNFLEWLKIFIIAFLKVILDWKKYDIYIAEMGIDAPFEPKNMSYLLKIIKPQIGAITNIGLEHSEYFDVLVSDKEDILRKEKILALTAKEELLLLKSLPQKGLAILNVDDEKISKSKNDIKARKITVSSKEKADFLIEETNVDLLNFKTKFSYLKKEYEINLPQLLPLHYAYSFVMAIAIAHEFKIDINEAIKILEKNFSLPPGRMSVFEGVKNTTIIDSSYNNATLSPILDILSLVRETAEKRRKLGIIGDMRELGTMSRISHEAVGKKILESLDTAILIGPLMTKFVSPILKNNNFKFYAFNTFSEAKDKILEEVKENDAILIKGSQNTLYLERAVEMLLKDKKDIQKLCRRGEFWDKKRQQVL